MTSRVQTHDDGYLLLEVLVATVVFALLSVAVFSGVRFSERAWQHADWHRNDMADMAAVHRVLRDAIARAYPEFSVGAVSDRAIAFDGEPDSVALVAPLPAAIETGVMARERFFIAKDHDDRSALFMAWHLDLPPSDGSPSLPDHRVELVGDVRRVAFAYFGRAAPGQQAAWFDRWTGLDHLPDVVRFHITFDDPARSAWPDLLVEPRITMNVACIYDPVATSCRRIQ